MHLHRPPVPTDGGDKRRLLGFLQYFRDRKPYFEVDTFGGNTCGQILWSPRNQHEVLQFSDHFFLYQGERNPIDFLYSRSQSFYHQKLLRQQLPIDSKYFSPPGYIRFVKALISQKPYDFLLINYIDFAHLALAAKTKITKTMIDIHDLGSQGRLMLQKFPCFQNLRFDYEANLHREAKLLNQFDRIIVNSIQEAKILAPQMETHKLWLVPHLVEETGDTSDLVPYTKRSFKYDLIFVGTSRRPNVDAINFFLKSVFPKIVRHRPKTRLALVGSISEALSTDLALVANIDSIGYVPCLSDVYLAAKVVICPLLDGAGTKVKLQEALAYAIPIVTTSTGASGLRLTDGVNAMITDDPNQFAQQTLHLLESPESAQRLSEQAAVTFTRHYSNAAVYEQLDRIFGIGASNASHLEVGQQN